MGVFYADQGQDRDASVWEEHLDQKHEPGLLAVGCPMSNMVDRPAMANRRLSWMDQIGTPGQRRQSRVEPTTPGDNYNPSSPWVPQSPSSNLRATAAIWTPQFGCPDLDEDAVDGESTEDLESKFAATTIGEPRNRRGSSATGSNDSSHTRSPFDPIGTPETNNNPSRQSGRKDSNISDASRKAVDEFRIRNSLSTFYPQKAPGFVGEQSSFQATPSMHDSSPLKPTISAPTTGTHAKRGGLPELRTTSLSDFRLDEVRGPLATDDSLYAVVEFKLFRSEVYQLRRDWIGGAEGVCLVIVEADRGVDLGKVHHIGTDAETARELKRALNRRHWSALLQNSATSKPSDEESEIAFKQVYEWTASSPFAGGFTAGDGTMPPRSIVRRANRMEIAQLQFKEGLEERARRLCWQKAKDHGFTMEILAAEFQFDHQKLTFYFLAPGYVAFNPLINELYKIFKTRIWFVPLNPASFVNPSPSSHAPSSSGGSGSELYPNSPHPSQGSAPKGNRRDSRSHPIQNIAFGASNIARANPPIGAGRPNPQGGGSHTSPWNSGQARGPFNNDWPPHLSPVGFKSPQNGQGPWS